MMTVFIRSKVTEYQQSLWDYARFLFLVLASTVLTSCSSDDGNNCIPLQVETVEVTAVNALETGQVNEPISIEVLFDVRNSCGDFNRFLETGSTMEKNIEVEAKYEGCACNQVIETITAVYEFTPEEVGEYTLNFRSGTNEFITVTITVTE